MADTETEIKNLALNRIGQTVLTAAQYTADTEPNAKFANLNYTQCRDALLRSHWWRFAGAVASLTASAVDTLGQWSYGWALPDDFLRMKYWWDDNDTRKEVSLYSCEIVGLKMYTNESVAKIKYIKKETDVTKFDPLFTEILVLQLALRLSIPISKGLKFVNSIRKELYGEPGIPGLMTRVRTIDKQEQNTVGRGEADTWNDSLYGFGLRDPTKLGSN